jgi:hypothetical protein
MSRGVKILLGIVGALLLMSLISLVVVLGLFAPVW